MRRASEAPRSFRSADARRMPWRGGGETAEVAASPVGAGIDASGWRVALGGSRGDGASSTFHEVDRTFAVLAGGNAALSGVAGPPSRFDTDAAPLRFACPVTALEVTTEHPSFDCAVVRCDLSRGLPRADKVVTMLDCGAGEVDTALGRLGPFDALVVPAGSSVDVGPRGARVATIWAVAAHRPSRDP